MNYYERLSSAELREAYKEIVEFHETGVLPGHYLVRTHLKNYISENPLLRSLETDPNIACRFVVDEMARRFSLSKES